MYTRITARCVVTILFSVLICVPFHTIALCDGSAGALPGGQQAPSSSSNQADTIRRLKMDPSIALGRTNPKSRVATRSTPGRGRGTRRTELRSPGRFSLNKPGIAPAHISATAASVGTGSGDIDEVEPNDQVVQNVFMPANIFGQIRPSRDEDFFAFPSFAGEQINVEAFAARISGSVLVADIALFDSAGNVITEAVGDGVEDPLIQFVAPSDGILFAGITDADGSGGSNFIYLLSISAGVDVDEVEPNSRIPQVLPASAVTVFGNLASSSDVDLYSFNGFQGETVILDVDAAVIGSSLVSELTLSDAVTGIEYFSSDHDDGDDPRFNILLPITGTYVIGVASISGPGGFYRMNVSFVPGDNSPTIATVTRIGKKLIDITGTGLNSNSIVEVDGTQVRTFAVQKGELNAKAKAKRGAVITVANLPDLRRSNPLVVQ